MALQSIVSPVKLASSIALAAVLAGTALSASAQTTYGTRSAFEAAVTSHYDYDFNGGTMVTTLSSSIGHLADVTTVGGDAYGAVKDGALWGSTGGSFNAFTTLRFDFLQPVTGFGFDDLDLNGQEWAIIDVTFTGGSTQRYAVTTLTPFTPVFFGITSNTGLASVEVFSDTFEAGNSPGSRANLIDNVSIAPAAVPEPTSVAMVLFGMLVLTSRSLMTRRKA